jgi:hypothetical protein
MWAWFLTYLPAAALLMIVGATSIVLPIAVFWMAAFMVSGIVASNSKCPRCGNLFCRRRRLGWNPYTQHCLSCGLPLRTPIAG